MDALTKKTLNSLKCPICRGPIDILSWKTYKPYQFGCAYDVDHYKISINDGYLSQEQACFYDKKHKYAVTKEYKDFHLQTTIAIYDADIEQRVNFSFLQKIIKTELELFDFRKFDVEKAINRIKTYLVFQ